MLHTLTCLCALDSHSSLPAYLPGIIYRIIFLLPSMDLLLLYLFAVSFLPPVCVTFYRLLWILPLLGACASCLLPVVMLVVLWLLVCYIMPLLSSARFCLYAMSLYLPACCLEVHYLSAYLFLCLSISTSIPAGQHASISHSLCCWLFMCWFTAADPALSSAFTHSYLLKEKQQTHICAWFLCLSIPASHATFPHSPGLACLYGSRPSLSWFLFILHSL